MLKLKNWFRLPVSLNTVDTFDGTDAIEIKDAKYLTNHHAEKVEEAINNYDRIVQENTELLERVEWLHNKLIIEGKRYGVSTSRGATQGLISRVKALRNG